MFRAIIKALLAGRAIKKLSWKFEILLSERPADTRGAEPQGSPLLRIL